MFGILQKIPALISTQSVPWKLSRFEVLMIYLQGWVWSLGRIFRVALVGVLFSVYVCLTPSAFAQTAEPAAKIEQQENAATTPANTKPTKNVREETLAASRNSNPGATANVDVTTDANANPNANENETLASPDSTEPAGNDFYNDPFAPPEETTAPPSFLMLWLRLMGILLIFVLLAVGVLRWVKSRQRQQSQTHPLYQEVASFPLGLNQKIKIVKVIQDYYVIAIAGDNITLLRRLDDKLSLDELKLFAAEGGLEPSVPFFGELLQRYIPMTGVNASNANQKSKVAKNPFTITRNLRDRVRRL